MILFQCSFQLLCFSQPPSLLTLEIIANLPDYGTLPVYILAEICQSPCLFRPPLLFETREYLFLILLRKFCFVQSINYAIEVLY